MSIIVNGNLPVLPKRQRKPARTLAAAGILAAARSALVDVNAAEARKLAAAVAWAGLHVVEDPDLAETWGDTPVALTGPGAPLIGRGCVAEFAAVIGTTTNGGRAYLADAVELAHRLPEVYAQIQAGKLPAWKGRRIARETTILPLEATADLDARIATLAHKLSAAATQQLIDETVAGVLPEHAQEIADTYATPRVVIDHRQVSFVGTSTLYGALDLADALDLDVALDREAQILQDEGCEASWDARRAMALGRLARGTLRDGAGAPPQGPGSRSSVPEEGHQACLEGPQGPTTGRAVTLYVHLPADTSAGTAFVETGGGRLLTQAQVATWCAQPGVRVTIKPVIDLHDPLSSPAYVVPEAIKEHVELRDRTCAIPTAPAPTAPAPPGPARKTTSAPTARAASPRLRTSAPCASTTTTSRPTPAGPTAPRQTRRPATAPTTGAHPTATSSSATTKAPKT